MYASPRLRPALTLAGSRHARSRAAPDGARKGAGRQLLGVARDSKRARRFGDVDGQDLLERPSRDEFAKLAAGVGDARLTTEVALLAHAVAHARREAARVDNVRSRRPREVLGRGAVATLAADRLRVGRGPARMAEQTLFGDAAVEGRQRVRCVGR